MPTAVGTIVQGFYNKTPFPDYDLDRFQCREDLDLTAYPFARILDRSIPAEASVIDVGTGTGQLSAFLSLRRNCVWGIDFSDASLAKARALKDKLRLDSWQLRKVDILDTAQIDAVGRTFDFVLCMGVLHHTGDAEAGFRNLLRLLNPGGYVAVGLYNAFGRIPLQLRILLAETVFKKNQRVKDWFMRMQIGKVEDAERARGWWHDQYLHPHETTHTVGQVLRWFNRNGIDFIQTIPSCTLFNQTDVRAAGAWNGNRERYPRLHARIWKQLEWIWKTHREGGYWITFGRKR